MGAEVTGLRDGATVDEMEGLRDGAEVGKMEGLRVDVVGEMEVRAVGR